MSVDMGFQIVPPEPAKKPRRSITPIVIGVIGAVLVGMVLTLLVSSFWTLAVEAGGSCGTSSEGISHGPCPRGTAWMLPVSIISLFVVVPAALLGLAKIGSRRIGCLGAVVLALVGIFPGLAVFRWSHGRTLAAVWQAPPDRPATAEGLGGWLSGTTVVRARFDRLVGYDVATGAVRWTYTVPGRDVLCAMSRTAADGVGLIAHGAETQPCDRVTAVDLTTGRALWEHAVPAAGISSSISADVIAVTDGMAVIQTPQALMAVRLREGTPLWQDRTADRCRLATVAAGHDQVLTTVSCFQQVPRIQALDAATGHVRWTTKAPIQSDAANIRPLSADPAVLWIQEGGQRGVNVVASFDETGRAQASIPVDDGQRRLDLGDHAFRATPARNVVLQDGLLVAKAQLPGGKYRVIGYGLADGRSRWSTKVGDFAAMQAEPGRVHLLGDATWHPGLWALSLRDGKLSYVGLPRIADPDDDPLFYSTGDRYVVLTERATNPGDAPVAVFRAR
ncbi:outer membrane protein assembly factor BamB family protein [Actinoallomurus rhizosphaericola]|uniref:outer membrane protein assembly factor BamB family protein n=1 Tax=Actinoallomurus rhizosphaericola TaxID=2952536 RepID=UPI0020935F2C|nr:PQQ-binding-like beta-propeller repeat protein [Actinoallomurus rhizosphaericola]MCO5995790.1 PQQ-binding-like beta-propeller repeat protein [Actinoallomurus rhizosphaericola]